MSDKKFEFTGETKLVDGHVLGQIKLLRDLRGMKAGHFGGWIEYESNLSHVGDCWVYDSACVFGAARVTQDAKIREASRIFGNANVRGHANVANSRISGYATIQDEAYVAGSTVSGGVTVGGNVILEDSSVRGKIELYGSAELQNARLRKKRDAVWFSNVGSENGTLTVYRTKEGLHCTRGCYDGTVDEFLAEVKRTHGGKKWDSLYHELIRVAKLIMEGQKG